MHGLLGFLVALTVVAGTQSASLGDGPLGMNFFRQAMWWIGADGVSHQKQEQQPTTPPRPTVFPTISMTVSVQRYGYVELHCPFEGFPVEWTVISGQLDGIRAGGMLVFPRMTGDVQQEYQCRVEDEVASVKVDVIVDIPQDETDAVSDGCEHGKVCQISCGLAALWDGVMVVAERWTPLQWPTKIQVDPIFISDGFMVADMFTTPTRMLCTYRYAITETGAVQSGLPVGTQLVGQPTVYNITINPPRPQIINPFSCYSNGVVQPVCVGKPATILCDGLVPSSDFFADIFWLQETANGTIFIPDDPSLEETTVDSPIAESLLGIGKSVRLTFDPVKPEHVTTYVCKIQSSVHSVTESVRLEARPEACL